MIITKREFAKIRKKACRHVKRKLIKQYGRKILETQLPEYKIMQFLGKANLL